MEEEFQPVYRQEVLKMLHPGRETGRQALSRQPLVDNKWIRSEYPHNMKVASLVEH